jgi:multiple antibiotic resistance protein
MSEFFVFFIPLCVAIDPFGMVPVFLGVTTGMGSAQRRRVTLEATGVGFLICLGFMFLGRWIFNYLGIDESDFKIAGGILLLVLAVYDLLIPGKPAVDEATSVGLVPLAMPLIAGPAALTTTLVLAQQSYAMTAVALAANFVLLLAAMLGAEAVGRLIGLNAMRAISKLVMVLLAAIAVNFIRSGVVTIWRGPM